MTPLATLAAAAVLSMGQAHHAITRWVGASTKVVACQRVDARAVRCVYTTPSANVGITVDGQSGTYESAAVARLTRHHGVQVHSVPLSE